VRNASTLSALERARDEEMNKVALAIQRPWRALHVKGKVGRSIFLSTP
jgi:myosin heavy subunit